MDTAQVIEEYKKVFDDYLHPRVKELDSVGGLHRACAYSLSAGGKRLRPVIAMLACGACGGNPADTLPVGLAIEMIHTFSLIHDDLPAIDNDDMRRGRPTCHKTFGEASAILAGDALIFMAFSSLGNSGLPAEARSDISYEIAEACGLGGLIKGEYDDIMAEKKEISLDDIVKIYTNKTSRLFELSAWCGARVAGAPEEILHAMKLYGRRLGLAFQSIDDILDIVSDSANLGKTAGKDLIQDKATIVKVLGIEKARQWAADQTGLALEALRELNAPHLEGLAEAMLERIN